MASGTGDPLLAGEDGGRGCGCGFLPSSVRLKTSVWSELGGAVGDLGTYIPIVLALSLASHLDLGTTLIFTALYIFATGVLFGIPMPVQPMKSIAAVALSSAQLTVPQIMCAGLAVAAVLVFLGATGLMTLIYRLLPLPVVRSVQLAQGLSFAFTAVKYVRYVQNFSHSSSASTAAPRPLLGLDGLVLALAALLFIVLATGSGDDEDVVGTDRARRRRPSGYLASCCSSLGSSLPWRRATWVLTKEESFVMLICSGVSLTGSSAALGFISGIVLFLLLRLREVNYRGVVDRWGYGRRQTRDKVVGGDGQDV